MRVGKRGEDTGKRRYDAFISYCHGGKDSKLAERLQVLLESYRLPKSEKRLRVFRDNTELTAGSDLGGELREALERSRYLISVCSEKTKDSQWCMEEIRQFKELHRGSTENILILLTSGTPETAIPEPLRTNGKGGKLEPLYVDVRGGTLRESLRTLKSEYYKLAAALLECGLDDLLQRNRRRRRRRTCPSSFTIPPAGGGPITCAVPVKFCCGPCRRTGPAAWPAGSAGKERAGQSWPWPGCGTLRRICSVPRSWATARQRLSAGSW